MISLNYTVGGRTVSAEGFGEAMQKAALEAAMSALEERYHGRAASIVDPETGIHPPVIVRRISDLRLVLRTNGSPSYKQILNRRIVGFGDSLPMISLVGAPAGRTRLVYLAHSFGDGELASKIAAGLNAAGIEVWYAKWEINSGDSIKRKMEEGLENCTHFIVLLTPDSLKRPWVNEEIDAGFLRQVEGQAKFIGLRYNVSVDELSIFLRTRLCPEYNDSKTSPNELADDIFGVSKKPLLGTATTYVADVSPGKEGWSHAALAIASYLCRTSEHGVAMDPQTSREAIIETTGLSPVDADIGLLDLAESGLIENQKFVGGGYIVPNGSLFYEFDDYGIGSNPLSDAQQLARYMANAGEESFYARVIGEKLDWSPRRLNPALAYLVDTKIVEGHASYDGSNYSPHLISIGVPLTRYVREHP